MNTIHFTTLSKEHLEGTWELFSLLKNEAAEVSFTELQRIHDLEAWISNDCHLTYIAYESETGKVLCAVRGRRDPSPEKKHAVFLTAATHPNARGQGIAAKLTEFALKEMKTKGVTLARIYVYSDNVSSLNAVNKLHFIESGRVVHHHLNVKTGAFVDDVIFHRFL